MSLFLTLIIHIYKQNIQIMSCLDNPANSDILEWLPNGDGFLIKDKKRFGTEILPQVLKQTQYSSFTRRMNRWQFKLNNLGHKQASYHHPLFRRGRQDLAMQMAPIRQKQYGSGGDRKQSKSVSAKTTTNEAKTENKVDNSSSDDESTTDKGNSKHTTDRNSTVEGWKMELKGPSSSSVASDAAYHTTGDQASHHYNTTAESNNVTSYNVSSQSIMHPPSFQGVPKPHEMEMPYNHNMSYHMNMQHSMNHTQMQPSSSIPMSQSMPYHIQQSPHIEQSQHRLFPHIEQQHHQQHLPFPHQQYQQQSHPWMQKQFPMAVTQPSYPTHQNHVSFPYAPPTVPIDNSRNPQELIEYHEKLIDYLSQYQSCLSNDLELSKRAIEYLKKDTTSKDENQS